MSHDLSSSAASSSTSIQSDNFEMKETNGKELNKTSASNGDDKDETVIAAAQKEGKAKDVEDAFDMDQMEDEEIEWLFKGYKGMKEQVFHIANEVKIPLYCSAAATTDYDLTGSTFIVRHRQFFSNRFIMELGAGIGLAGFSASIGIKEPIVPPSAVLITDGEALIIKLLRRNVKRLRRMLPDASKFLKSSVRTTQYTWGKSTNSERIKEYCRRQFSELSKSQGDFLPDVFLGADCFHPSFGDPGLLFQSLNEISLDACQKQGKTLDFYAAFADRGNVASVFAASKQYGFTATEFPIDEMFKEIGDISVSDISVLKLYLVRFSHS